MKRANFPGRKNERRKGALERLNNKLKLNSAEFASSVKRFKNAEGSPSLSKAIELYRTELKRQCSVLEQRIKS